MSAIKEIKHQKKTEFPEIDAIERANPKVPPHIIHYNKGRGDSWDFTRLAIFQMYLNGDLLNYENLIQGIVNQFNKFDNPQTVRYLELKLLEYQKELEKSSSAGSQKEIPPGNFPPSVPPPFPPNDQGEGDGF